MASKGGILKSNLQSESIRIERDYTIRLEESLVQDAQAGNSGSEGSVEGDEAGGAFSFHLLRQRMATKVTEWRVTCAHTDTAPAGTLAAPGDAMHGHVETLRQKGCSCSRAGFLAQVRAPAEIWVLGGSLHSFKQLGELPEKDNGIQVQIPGAHGLSREGLGGSVRQRAGVCWGGGRRHRSGGGEMT